MTVSKVQIKTAEALGIVENADVLAQACEDASFPYFLGLAIMEKETHGRNVWGHDKGGALSGYTGPVNRWTYDVFTWIRTSGGLAFASNGVGPMQLTWPGYFLDMEKQGLKPWDPTDNINYAVGQILAPAYHKAQGNNRKSFWTTAKGYNGAVSYADDAVLKADRWFLAVGRGDLPGVWEPTFAG